MQGKQDRAEPGVQAQGLADHVIDGNTAKKDVAARLRQVNAGRKELAGDECDGGVAVCPLGKGPVSTDAQACAAFDLVDKRSIRGGERAVARSPFIAVNGRGEQLENLRHG